MSYDSDSCGRSNDSLAEELIDHVDSVVMVCTERCIFTGLLVGVNDDAVKLITRGASGCPGNNVFGKVTVIRLRSIESVTFCNTSA